MNDKRLTKSYRATKLTLLCYAWRCSFKLQQIQSWETLFQRHPRHTSTNIHKHIVFVFFKKFSFFFFNFFLIFYWKPKTNKHTTKHIKGAIETRLTQIQPTKHTRDARIDMKSLERVFFHPKRRFGGRWIFPILRPLMRRIWRIKPIEVCQEHHGL